VKVDDAYCHSANGSALPAVGLPPLVRDEEAIRRWLVDELARVLHLPPGTIDPNAPLARYGVDSLKAVSLTGELEDWLGRPISPTAAWDFPTVAGLARFLAESSEAADTNGTHQPAADDELAQVLTELERLPDPAAHNAHSPMSLKNGAMMNDLSEHIARLSPDQRATLARELGRVKRNEPVAVIGLGCRFPGAENPQAFWKLLREGRDAVREIPRERWDINAYYDPNPDAPGRITTRWGCFLDRMDLFDANFFGIYPREANHLDPQQRLVLEVGWEAFEDAGQAPDRLAGSRTGVFLGISSRDYTQYLLRGNDPTGVDAYSGTGNAGSIAANRLSYLLDLRGPSYAVDTACSSALYAVHLACRSLREGESDMAVAGGVNALLAPELFIAFSRAHMLSPEGKCKTFDASADGYVRGEGCGMVVLKRLTDAQRDGDRILAVIRGTAINHDGRTPGITVPSGPAQRAVIAEALQDAGVSAADIRYVEAHGTATPLGDRVEIQALAEALGPRSPGAPRCNLGSVKANIGHLEAGAGIASLIKAVLCLHHAEIPPQRNLRQINPQILPSLESANLFIPTELVPFPSGNGPRLVGVSAYGFGGANSHVVLDEAPPAAPPQEVSRPLHLLTLSGKTETSLKALARSYLEWLGDHADARVADVCHTAAAGRAHFEHRVAWPVSSLREVRERLGAFVEGESRPGMHVGHLKVWKKPKVAFLFTGQGSQYPGMGRRLYDSQPTFRANLDCCDELLRPFLHRPLREVLFPETGHNGHTPSALPLHETAYTQPALFALEYSLARLWQSWGVVPDAVLGHSVGEYVAACIAGVFSLEEGIELIAERARLMQSLPPDGSMAAVFGPEDRVAPLLRGLEAEVALATLNGPANTVISGRREAVDAVLRACQVEGLQAKQLTVSHAFHSPLLEPILAELEALAGQLRPQAPQLPLVSNLTGQFFGPGEKPTADYWRRHARQPVRFADGVKTLAGLGCDIFVEIGPHPTLLTMAQTCLPPGSSAWLPSLRRNQDDWRVLLDAVAELYTRGVEIDWRGLDRDYPCRLVALPTYPFERQRYWLDVRVTAERIPEAPKAAAHPLLGRRVR